ncbi:MAG: EAL domain-containing protein [Leptospiraceae bacterium]|nr:EAL domain-containing protein [Leptospiraceae bacterium]MDW8307008.1 EAL domain-containing protein [Leptospiraceae bacterium]
MADAERTFKHSFIEKNRGKPLFLVRCQNLENITVKDFLGKIPDYLARVSPDATAKTNFYVLGDEKELLIGIVVTGQGKEIPYPLPNIDGAFGRFHDEALRQGICDFDFGVGRTQANFVSDVDEIYEELLRSSLKNLKDNLVRWSWTYFNRANDYFANEEASAVIQPIVYYDPKKATFSVRGGEVFVGGHFYQGYADLMEDIPVDQDRRRIELLILEKLVMACHEAPGLLKFNISPQTLIDTFHSAEKVYRFNQLLHREKINPRNVRLELVEKPYEEKHVKLKDVCQYFWEYGISFAADDFGVKSQSHQIVLDLGEMIKEFKLDPISFKFKPEEDHTKFLDNLAFIDYCVRLADNREAIITAEAVDDFDTLRFLITHQVHYFQSNIFFAKMNISDYKANYANWQGLPEEVVQQIMTEPHLMEEQKQCGNIFETAKRHNLI